MLDLVPAFVADRAGVGIELEGSLHKEVDDLFAFVGGGVDFAEEVIDEDLKLSELDGFAGDRAGEMWGLFSEFVDDFGAENCASSTTAAVDAEGRDHAFEDWLVDVCAFGGVLGMDEDHEVVMDGAVDAGAVDKPSGLGRVAEEVAGAEVAVDFEGGEHQAESRLDGWEVVRVRDHHGDGRDAEGQETAL